MNIKNFGSSIHTAVVSAFVTCSLLAGCLPAASVAGPSFAVAAAGGSVAGAKAWLKGGPASDFSRTLIGSADRWGRRAATRSLKAFGDTPNAAWSSGGSLGLPLTTFGCTSTDRSTNGAAVRTNSAERCVLVTHEGKLVDIDRTAPATGYVTTNLVSLGPAATFTHTYVSLSQDANVAFVVSDQGNAYAIDLTTVVSSAHPDKLLALGQGACLNGALFPDPLASSMGGATTLYVVANNGMAIKVIHTPATPFASSGFTTATVGKATAITTPINGTELVKSSPMALGGILAVGDRGGNANLLNTHTGVLRSWNVSPNWPIETTTAVDVDDDLDITDLFATAGSRLAWVDVVNNTVYYGQNAVVEQNGPTGTITPSNVTSFLQTGNQTLKCDYNNRDAISLYANSSNTVALPECPSAVDINNLGYGNAVTGQPPKIATDSGSGSNGGSNRVADVTAVTSANLSAPWYEEVEGTTYAGDDGSTYLSNTGAGQVLFRPATSLSGNRWTTTYHNVLVDGTKFYELCGGNDGTPLAIGAKGTNTPFRRTVLGNVRKAVVGNLGLYLMCSGGGYNTGSVLFLPKVGVTSAFGLTVAAEKLYVLSRTGDPMGACVDRSNPAKDVVYVASYTQAPSNVKGVYTLDSTSSNDLTAFPVSGVQGPNDVCLDDKSNLIVDDVDARKLFMVFKGGTGNTRTWGATSPTAGATYTLVDGSSSNNVFWHVGFNPHDPQTADGCLMISATQWGSFSNAVFRVDDSGRLSVMAGLPNTGGGFAGDGGWATAASLNLPRGVCADASGNVYLCDTSNNRVRKLTMGTYTGAEARGYMRFNATSYVSHPLLKATLQLWSKLKAKLLPPRVGVASPFLTGTTTQWTADNLTAVNAPAVNAGSGISTPTSPTLSGGKWDLSVGNTVTYELAPGALPLGTSTPYLCLGLLAPTDGTTWAYGNSEAVPSTDTRGFSFDTPRSNSNQTPQLSITYANTAMVQGIGSPPVVYGIGSSRTIFVVNGNSIFRYPADPANPAAFATKLDFTMGRMMGYVGSASGAWSSKDGSKGYQPNASPAFFDGNDRAYTLDVLYQSFDGKAYYALNAFNADAPTGDMRIAGGTYKDLMTLGLFNADLAATATENAGIYMSSGPDVTDAYFGLYNGRIYRVLLN